MLKAWFAACKPKRGQHLFTTGTLAGAEVYNEGAVALAAYLPSLLSLRVLNVGGCGLTIEGLRSFAGCLPHLHSLEHLTLKYNLMFVAGCAVLLPALTALKSLEVLSLRGCALGCSGSAALSLELPRMRQLKELDLAENGLRYVHTLECWYSSPCGVLTGLHSHLVSPISAYSV